MQIKLGAFLPCSLSNGPGCRAVVWVQGCHKRCPASYNPGFLPFAPATTVTVEELWQQITLPLTAHDSPLTLEGVTFSGGEPFEQAEVLACLAGRTHAAGLNVTVFSGHTLEELKSAHRPEWDSLLRETDLLIDGPYVQKLACSLPLRGSSNQRLHFLTGRIRPEEVTVESQLEVMIDQGGEVTITGVPSSEFVQAMCGNDFNRSSESE